MEYRRPSSAPRHHSDESCWVHLRTDVIFDTCDSDRDRHRVTPSRCIVCIVVVVVVVVMMTMMMKCVVDGGDVGTVQHS